MNENRRDRLQALTAEAARSEGRLTESTAEGTPGPGDLYVLSQTADFPVEWLLLERAADDPDRWLAVPADTNPLRGPGDLWIGPAREGGPLSIRCRHGVGLPGSALDGGHRTGGVADEEVARALETVHNHQRGTLEPGPLAEEVAADLEYQDWERGVLGPARKAVAELASHDAVPEPRPPQARVWVAIAATLALASIGLGAWNLALRQDVARLSAPILIGGGSQEIVVGADVRAPAPLRLRRGEQGLLVFIVLADEVADYERYRVELTTDDGTLLYTSPDTPRESVPELSLLIPGQFLDGPEDPSRLTVLGLEGDRTQRLAEIPILIEPAEDAP